MARTIDRELEQYRDLLDKPTEFKDGFGWSTIVGILFCGLVMMPGAIYLGLMTGGSMGAAATWVTVILFSEVARRAMKPMSKQNLVVLLHAAGVIMAGQVLFPGGPLGQVVYRAYLVTSDAVRDAGMRDYFPSWFVPRPDSAAILERNIFHADWAMPLMLVAFTMFIGLVNKYTLGYFFFRLTSDIENLPFPLAPIQAQGAMAMAESDATAASAASEESERDAGKAAFLRSRRGEKKKSERWRLFSLGASIGVAFGFLQVGVPAVTGLIFDKPLFLIPQPFVETTTLTEGILPATPTGMTVDIGIILLGFVLPFWAVLGTFTAIAATIVINPILHHLGVLTRWQPGMNTVNTTFANSIDFWMSFGIGAAFGIAIVSIYQTVRDVRRKIRESAADRRSRSDSERQSIWSTPKIGRGDYPLWIALVGYIAASTALIAVCYILLKDTGTSRVGILAFLTIFTFLYNPFISYVNARLLGIAGQNVDIPFVKETAFILSGARGIDVWLAPIPITNVGYQAQSFRVNELTGVSFWSLIKTDLIATPVLFLLSWLFWGFIWHSSPVPSDVFPAAQINWELRTKTDTLLYTSTFVPEGQTESNIAESQFMEAIHPGVIGAGTGVTIVLFAVLSTFGLPVLFVYGIIRGLGQLPHYMLLEIVGALIGRFYLRKRFGEKNFLRSAPTVLAGYFTGVGLIGMATIAMKLIQSAVSAAPF